MSRPPRRAGMSGWKKFLLGCVLLVFLLGGGVSVYFYVRFSRLIDARLSGDVFNNASLVFAAPVPVSVGEAVSPQVLVARLRKAGYSEDEGNRLGAYKLAGSQLQVRPGPESFFETDPPRQGPAGLTFRDGHIVSITALDSSRALDSYLLEPEVITTLFDRSRTKRRLVRYQDLPKVLVDAILATEDHRFFSHHGVNIYRILAAALTDLRAEERVQGGSTLTMQLARNFFLTPRRTIRRKLAEVCLALLLEQRLSKEQIFELYSNQVYLGQRGSFSIYGIGEGAYAYFNKDVNSLTLPEAALLAGLIRGPNLYSPYKYPARTTERRNFVLRRMLETGCIDATEAERASGTPLGVVRQNVEALEAPFFVDMVKDQLIAQFPERDLVSQSYRIYTTLDLDLQRAASEAVRAGMAEVDQQVAKQRRGRGAPPRDPNQPQVALIVLDPHTGALKALVGGRDYAVSQLNHVLARRQPGSSFKPFVYAAALSSGVDGSQPLVTPATLLVDEPTTFQFGDLRYEPENYKHEYHGSVTVREALTHSLNVATVRLAEMEGYDKIRNLAIAAGINKDLLATPAMALGAYVATPLEIAGAYTIFANSGDYMAPRYILGVNEASGRSLWRSPVITRPALDPRVSFLMVSLLESVINNGTGAGVRSRGFTLPAAGKTGTSHDGWLAGFTSNLLAVVWVGYDDDRELQLSGASSALPVWTEFMKRACQIPAYQNVQEFTPPPGIVSVPIPAPINAGGLADPVENRMEYFIEGTEPRTQGPADKALGILTRIFRSGGASSEAAAHPAVQGVGAQAPSADLASGAPSDQQKKSVIRKFLSIFKGGGSSTESKTPPAEKSDPKD